MLVALSMLHDYVWIWLLVQALQPQQVGQWGQASITWTRDGEGKKEEGKLDNYGNCWRDVILGLPCSNNKGQASVVITAKIVPQWKSAVGSCYCSFFSPLTPFLDNKYDKYSETCPI